jgi:hypothetical protein
MKIRLATSALALILACAAASETPDATPFPHAPDKKGLQVQMVEDAIDLGVHHAAINVSLGALIASVGADGQTLKINESYARQLDAQIKPLTKAGVVVYAILLAYPTHDPAKDKHLVHPKARVDGRYNIAAFNTATAAGDDCFSQLVSILAERYGGAHPDHGRVWGWIVGNEVNSPFLWYNLGESNLLEVASEYEKAVRLVHDAVQRKTIHARVFISLDHHWNSSMPGISDREAYKGRDFLDTFARLVRERGDFEWHVAHHPYPDDLGNPRTWLDKDAWSNDDAPHLTFKNLEVACRHMEKPELQWHGTPRRIILSEQGIHCLATPEGEKLQAAGFVYAWEKVSRMEGIDALIWHRQVDHAHEGGLRLGLWENKPGSIADPGRPRMIHGLFKKAGTGQWGDAAQFALPVTGLKSWDELAK